MPTVMLSTWLQCVPGRAASVILGTAFPRCALHVNQTASTKTQTTHIKFSIPLSSTGVPYSTYPIVWWILPTPAKKDTFFRRNPAINCVSIILKTIPHMEFVIQMKVNLKSLYNHYLFSAYYLLANFTLVFLLILPWPCLLRLQSLKHDFCLPKHGGS